MPRLHSLPNLLAQVQFNSATQSCPTLCDPMDWSTPGFTNSRACSNWCPSSRWWRPTFSSSVIPSPPAFNLSQHQGLFQWVSSSHQVAKVLELQLQHQSLKWIFRTDFLQDGLVGSPCSPRDSQGSSPTPKFKSISSSMLIFLYGSILTSIHHTWKNHSFDYPDLCQQSNVSAFKYTVLVDHSFSSKEQAPFNFMAAVTIYSDFGAQENKVCHCFHCLSIYLPWSDGTGCHDLSFLKVEF